jgi:glycosyltransferase involved in cell wall biosynthesis
VTSSLLITIITVTYNAEHCLERTIASVSSRKNHTIEYCVIDGGSSDGTLGVIRSHESVIDRWISEPDKGIYDAMNKGIELAQGEYLLFLNAGDELALDPAELLPVLAERHVMVYGRCNMLHENGSLSYVKGKPLKNIGKLVRGTPLCHQAILYRRDSIGHYDTRYRIIADRVLTYELVKKYGLSSTRFVDSVIANYYEGGFSRQHVDQWKDEEFQFQREAGWHLFAAYRRVTWLLKKLLKRAAQ